MRFRGFHSIALFTLVSLLSFRAFAVVGGGNGAERGGGQDLAQEFATDGKDAVATLTRWKSSGRLNDPLDQDLAALDLGRLLNIISGNMNITASETEIKDSSGTPRDFVNEPSSHSIEIYAPSFRINILNPIERQAMALHEYLAQYFYPQPAADRSYRISSRFRQLLAADLDLQKFKDSQHFEIEKLGDAFVDNLRASHDEEVREFRLLQQTSEYAACVNVPANTPEQDTWGPCFKVTAMVILIQKQLNPNPSQESSNDNDLSMLQGLLQAFGGDSSPFSADQQKALLDGISQMKTELNLDVPAPRNEVQTDDQEYLNLANAITVQNRQQLALQIHTDLQDEFKRLISLSNNYANLVQEDLQLKCPGRLRASIRCFVPVSVNWILNKMPPIMNGYADEMKQVEAETLGALDAYQE